jgi:hypothetical protein
MNCNPELSMLNEIIYNSRTLMILFGKESSQLKQIYGNKWLLCAVIDGKIKILQSSDDRAELEEIGFKLDTNILFDVLNPVISVNYNYKRRNSELIY